ncbi:hypothetical protein [Nocardia beijingensis]|uniref:Uncharacterized protein n=1 Tax=Nocardia beijingensis TaxID=95162 RepID=A0ABW7WR83_9NOCA
MLMLDLPDTCARMRCALAIHAVGKIEHSHERHRADTDRPQGRLAVIQRSAELEHWAAYQRRCLTTNLMRLFYHRRIMRTALRR